VPAVRILGGGPAGSSAALSALLEGAAVEIAERSPPPRHKVCGEFLSPEIAPALDHLRVFDSFLGEEPFRVRRVLLAFGSRTVSSTLAEPAFGLSRRTFDRLLWERALAAGARHTEVSSPQIVATGRPGGGSRGTRLFGFKAHFEGPQDDAVELYFAGRTYTGVNCIEGGRTNVCGLAPEDLLQSCRFEPEALIERCASLKARLAPLSRVTEWFFTGPLIYAQRWEQRDVYLAGDALSFVDPFTGSGLLCGVRTGSLAGQYAARGLPIADYVAACRSVIHRPFALSSVLRSMAMSEYARWLAGFVPVSLLFRLTRPR
jgi:flavin-dependent dehydrogenase